MSFILDALKKSESDRQRQSGPSLFEVKVAPPRRTLPIWAVAIAILLLVNVIVISWMLLRHPAAQQPAAASNAPAATQPAAASRGDAVPPPLSGSAPLGTAALPKAAPSTAHSSIAPAPQTASVGPVAPAAAAASPAGHPASSAPPSAAAPLASETAPRRAAKPPGDNSSDYAPAVQPAAGSGAAGDAAGSAGDLPLYQQIVSSDGLPALHLDLHVFADRPQDRFVMINMHRVGEGDSLPDGVQVDAIRPDGVVLSYRGTRFLLPRN